MGRDAVTITHSGPLKACAGCVELNEIRHYASSISQLAHDTEERVTAVEVSLTEQGQRLAVMAERWTHTSEQIPGLLDGLRREFAAAITISKLETQGKDPRAVTPSRLPELKAGPVSLRGPVWLVLVVAVLLAVVLGGFAAGAYVAAEVWRPAKAAAK